MGKIRSALSELRLYLCNRIVSHFPSHALRIWFYRQIMDVQIASDASVFMGAWLYCAGGLEVGEEAAINEDCRLDARGTIKIGRRAVLTAGVTILTADHDPQDPTFQSTRLRAVLIGDYVFVGTRAMILPGVELGMGAIVGAGSVVTKSVPAFTIVAGNPAIEIGQRPRELSYRTFYRRLFH